VVYTGVTISQLPLLKTLIVKGATLSVEFLSLPLLSFLQVSSSWFESTVRGALIIDGHIEKVVLDTVNGMDEIDVCVPLFELSLSFMNFARLNLSHPVSRFRRNKLNNVLFIENKEMIRYTYS
jgi:hypothetical protein